MDKENFVSSFANENMKLENIEKYNTLEEALNKNDMIVTGVPISKDKKYKVTVVDNVLRHPLYINQIEKWEEIKDE